MNYIDFNTLNKNIIQWLPKLPRNLDLIVGIPRSGLMTANLLSLYLNLPLTDVDGLINGRVFAGGRRLNGLKVSTTITDDRGLNVLVIDDSLLSGNQLNIIKEQISQARLSHNIQYGVVYILPGKENYVDYYYEAVSKPRIFQWNIMHSYIIEGGCVDIDGVLCVDPTEEENDDDEQYIKFIENATPFWIPEVRIRTLVTCRLEKYRAGTIEWLRKHGVDYEELIMMDLPNKKARQKYGHSKYKAEIYKQSKANIFFESSFKQAKEIVNITHKPVFCVSIMEFVTPLEPRYLNVIRITLKKFLPHRLYVKITTFYQRVRRS